MLPANNAPSAMVPLNLNNGYNMKRVLWLFLSLISLQLFAQKKEFITLYYEDSYGKSNGVVYAKGYYYDEIISTNEFNFGEVVDYAKTGEWTYYYSNGQIKEQGKYEKNKKTGTWKFYHSNGQLWEQGSYKDNERTGKWTGYNEDGKKIRSVDYSSGVLINYFETGAVFDELHFLYGADEEIRFDSYVQYYPNGRRRMEGKLDRNSSYQKAEGFFVGDIGWFRATGIWVSYLENGQEAMRYDFNQQKIFLQNTEEANAYEYPDASGGYGKGKKAISELSYRSEDGSAWVPFLGIEEPLSAANDFCRRQLLRRTTLSFQGGSFKRTGVWEYRDRDSVLQSRIEYSWTSNQPSGLAQFYYPDGQVKSEGQYDEQGRQTGRWVYYNKVGKIVEERQYDNGKISGLNIDYFDNGKMRSRVAYVNGKRVGTMELFYPSGKPLGKEFYQDGQFTQNGDFFDENGESTLSNGNGYRLAFHENGTLSYRGVYLNGKRQGLSTWYFPNGKKSSEENYVNGDASGEFRQYFESGALLLKGNMVKGKWDGEIEFYHPNGRLLGKDKYKAGEYLSPGDFFDERGNPTLSSGSGYLVNYYPNGRVKVKSTFLDYCRDGKSTWYHENGALKQEALYKYGSNQKPLGLRWEVLSSYTPAGRRLPVGTLKNGNGTWISYDANGKASTNEYKQGVLVSK